MPRNKDRLYIGIYARSKPPTMPGGEDRYHWALFTGPKVDTDLSHRGRRFHARNVPTPDGKVVWMFETSEFRLASVSLLACIRIAKITKISLLQDILANVPVKQDDATWNCVQWIKDALERLQQDDEALGRKVLQWDLVRDAAMEFSQRVMDRMISARARNIEPLHVAKAILDLLDGEEYIPWPLAPQE